LKILVVGAGATLAQALDLGCPPQICPPLIRDFARKMWSNYNPHPVLDVYLEQLGFNDTRDDLRELFYELEDQGKTNVERFMEFAWQNRFGNFLLKDPVPPGYIWGARIQFHSPTSITVGGGDKITFWDNFLYHGIGNPLVFYLSRCLFENGIGFRSLDLTKSLASKFHARDLVLNLNYDTTFEIALEQLNQPFAYAPNEPTDAQLLVCKPHGSLNMVMNDQEFSFGQPTWLGTPEPPNFRSFSGLIPPRLNKSYDQHPIARIIFDAARDRRPDSFVMWGVGLTESDADLLALYSRWARVAGGVEIINPSTDVADKARAMLKCEVRHFADVPAWLASRY